MSFIYVTEEGARISKRGGRFIIGRGYEVVLRFLPKKLTVWFLLTACRYLHGQLRNFLQRNSCSGYPDKANFAGRLNRLPHVNVHKQAAQIDLIKVPSFNIEIARKIILAKTHNQITLLRRYERNSNDANCFGMGIKNICWL